MSHQTRLSLCLGLTLCATLACSTAQDEARANLQQAQESFDNGRRDEAQQFLQAALDASPQNPEALTLQGKIFLQQGNLAEAAKALTAARAITPDQPAILLALAQAHDLIAQAPTTLSADRVPSRREALALYLQVAAADPFRTDLYLPIGEALEALGQPSDAIDAYTNAILTDTTSSPDPALRLARLYARLNFPTHANAAAEVGLKLSPTHVELSLIRAESAFALRDFDAAADAFSNAITFFISHIDPTTAPSPSLLWRAHLGRAQAYTSIGHREFNDRQTKRANSSYIKAIDDLDAALKVMPKPTKTALSYDRRNAEIKRQYLKGLTN
jgi:tetratricopeptide (TPR) repeat protein